MHRYSIHVVKTGVGEIICSFVGAETELTSAFLT